MRVRILGAVQVMFGGRPVDLGLRKPRLIVGILALEAGRQVSVERLAELLWPRTPPSAPAHSVRVSVSRLRAALTAADSSLGAALRTEGAGYTLDVDPACVDVHQFSALVRQASQASGDAERVELLDEALALWRGPVLAGDVPDECRDRLCQGLDAARLAAVEERCGAALRLGRHASLVSELARWVAENPLRERMRAVLMQALYRCGQRAEALAVYREGRLLLVEELGLEPGPELQALEQAILLDDPALQHAAPAPAPPPTPAATPAAAPAAAVPITAPREVTAAPGVTAASVAVPAARPPVPAQLPATAPGFTGRVEHLAALDGLLGDVSTGAPVAAVTGTAGVGKTALALHWAHRVVGHFPDGQLYVNLRGYDPAGAVSAAEAVQGLLHGLGVPSDRLPSGLGGQCALYRSLLAGRRVLVVLDNVRDAGQARPLLPGSPGSLTVVTSRNQLAGLVAVEGARPVVLDVLERAELGALLASRIGAARVQAEPRAVQKMLGRCAGLPLALVIVAARAAMRPTFPLAAIAEELSDARAGLEPFTYADKALDVRAVFSWSYDQLPAPAAALFRLLALIPGADVGRAAIGALAGVEEARAGALLAELTGASLVTEHAPGRYTFHDLLRAYAGELAARHDSADDRRAAQLRLLDHYLHTTMGAARLLEPGREPMDPAPRPPIAPVVSFRDRAAALEWQAAERTVLQNAVMYAAERGFERHAWQLAWVLTAFLQRGGYWHDALAAHQAALRAAERTGDQPGQSYALRGMSRQCLRLGEQDRAHHYLTRALTLCTRLGDRAGEGRVHSGLAFCHEQRGDLTAALRHAQRALDLYREAGLRHAEGEALNALGWTHALLGDEHRSLALCRAAVDLHDELGDVSNVSIACDSLGFALSRAGRHAEAVACFRRAVGLYDQIGDDYLLTETLLHLADAQDALGESGAATTARQRALHLLRVLGHPDADVVSADLARRARAAPPLVGTGPRGADQPTVRR